MPVVSEYHLPSPLPHPVMRVRCPGVMNVQHPGPRVAVCSPCRRSVLFAARVVLLVCVGGLTFLACVFVRDVKMDLSRTGIHSSKKSIKRPVMSPLQVPLFLCTLYWAMATFSAIGPSAAAYFQSSADFACSTGVVDTKTLIHS